MLSLRIPARQMAHSHWATEECLIDHHKDVNEVQGKKKGWSREKQAWGAVTRLKKQREGEGHLSTVAIIRGHSLLISVRRELEEYPTSRSFHPLFLDPSIGQV